MKHFLFFFLIFSCSSLWAQQSGDLKPTQNYDYRVSGLKGAQWIIEITSKENGSEIKLEENKNGKTKVHKVKIPEYPHEDGVLYIDAGGLSFPIFIIVSKSLAIADSQRELHLILPQCPRPVASARAQIESSSQIQINTGVKDFMISFASPDGSSKKTWTAPADSSKLCQTKWH